MTQPIYSLRVTDVFEALGSSPDGISVEEASQRQTLYGPNLLVEQPKLSGLKRLSIYVLHPMAYMLCGAGLIALLARQFHLALIIWGLVFINGFFSYWRGHRTEQALEALRRLLPDHSRVIRSGEESSVLASEIVPGDVLVLEEGDHIPADARVVDSYGLRTNNANLTGEAVPARKYADASLRDDIGELERPNLVFAGTSVVSGTGRAVVYTTGMYTQFGRIAHLTQTVPEDPSPIIIQMNRLTRRLSWLAGGIAVLVFSLGWKSIGFSLFDAFLLALGVLVAAVPEGLPATMTITLAMAAERLARRGVLVKTLSKIETLGGISVICTDKSGTLTQNQMTVREIWTGGKQVHLSGIGYDPAGAFTPDLDGTALAGDLKALLTAGALCNNARLRPPSAESPRWSSLGDQTEAALKVAARKLGLDEGVLDGVYPRLHELPFDARRKRMATIHHLANRSKDGTFPFRTDHPDKTLSASEQEIALVKGAPREVLQLCTQIQMNGKIQDLGEGLRDQVLKANDRFATASLRVLALAYKGLPSRTGTYSVEKVERDLIFLGLVGMMDPPRPEVAQAVRVCRQAGIRMVMVTGDYGLTAESIARRIGMLETQPARILTGAELEMMDDLELQAITREEVVYARMAPEHKLRLVNAFQASGEVVAVTGDGVNDAPALRKADVGVVMGMTGTDVAKEAADLVISNDNFYSLISAIEEGRGIFDNLRKFITYIFSSNVPEILPFILAGLFDIPPALTVLQVLAIDLGTDLLPGLALGAEKPEPDVMMRKPRRSPQSIIDRAVLRRAFLWLGPIESVLSMSAFLAVYFLAGVMEWGQIFSLDLAGIARQMWDAPDWVHPTAVMAYFSGVVMAQIGNAFACRSEINRNRSLGWFSNRFLWAGILVELGLFVALFAYNIRSQHSLGILFWMAIVFFPLILYSLDWLHKQLIRRQHESHRNGLRAGG